MAMENATCGCGCTVRWSRRVSREMSAWSAHFRSPSAWVDVWLLKIVTAIVTHGEAATGGLKATCNANQGLSGMIHEKLRAKDREARAG